MKKFIEVVKFVPNSIYGWCLELFYVRITNGKVYYEKSGTKAFLTFVRLGALIVLGLIALAYWIKIGGNVVFIKGEPAIRKTLTSGVLLAFSGLGAIIGTLLGYLQKNYTDHKKQVVQDFKAK